MRGDGLIELRVRAVRRDRLGELDALFELRPAVEAVLPRDDQLRIGEREAPSRERPRALALASGMVRDDTRGGGAKAGRHDARCWSSFAWSLS